MLLNAYIFRYPLFCLHYIILIFLSDTECNRIILLCISMYYYSKLQIFILFFCTKFMPRYYEFPLHQNKNEKHIFSNFSAPIPLSVETKFTSPNLEVKRGEKGEREKRDKIKNINISFGSNSQGSKEELLKIFLSIFSKNIAFLNLK